MLHFELSFFLLLLAHGAEFGQGLAIAALVGAHEGGAGEDVRGFDSPFFGHVADGLVVKGHQAAPEEGVLLAELGVHFDVETVVNEDKLGLARGEATDEDVSWVGIAVHKAPEEHLSGEEVDHCLHDGGERETETTLLCRTLPLITGRLQLFFVRVVIRDVGCHCSWWWLHERTPSSR